MNPNEITIFAVEIYSFAKKMSPKHVGLPRRSGVSDPVAAETVSPATVNRRAFRGIYITICKLYNDLYNW